MDIIQRIDELMKERNWSRYTLALRSGLSSSTIANIYRRHTVPSLATLKVICNTFGITLSQFFAEDMETVPLTKEQKQLFDKWANLTPSQKDIIEKLIQEFNSPTI